MTTPTPPLLAIVVPTRNRQQYVVPTIKSLLRIPCREIEIVVEDNSDTAELQHWLRQNITDPRIIYNYSATSTSQSGNYDRSLRGVTAEYAAFIGDDDSVNPEIVEATAWAKANGVDALTPASMVNYSWPDLTMAGPGVVQAGELAIRPFTCQVTYPDAKQELLKCVTDVGQSFHHMPKAYYGIVKRACLERVKAATGSYFSGVSPDMMAAVSLALQVGRMCYLDYPLFVPGSSRKSMAGVSGMKRHVGRLCDQSHLPPACEQSWSTIIPKFFSVPTIWGEAAVAALYANGRSDLLVQCNIPKYYGDCLAAHPEYARTILRQFPHAMRAVHQRLAPGILLLAARLARHQLAWARRFAYRLAHVQREATGYREGGLRDIEEAVLALTRFLAANKLSFRGIVEKTNHR